MAKDDFEKFAAEVVKKFSLDDKEWIKQYKGYAEIIENKEKSYGALAEEIKKKLNSKYTGLYLYTTIFGIKNGSAFDLRYQGESIATISISKIFKLKISSGGAHYQRVWRKMGDFF